MAKAVTLPADAFVFDLEDAVPPPRKAQARLDVAEALRSLDAGGRELCVRVNAIGTPEIGHDLAALPLDRLDSLMLPKVERPADLAAFERQLDALEAAAGRRTPLDLIVSLETPRAILDALAIAEAGRRVSALFFGSGDYTAATGSAVTAAALHWPRAMTVAAASAAGLQPIDAAFFTAVKDAEASRQDALLARELGFAGKLVFHPVQIAVANEVFAPSAEEIAWARKVAEAHREATEKGLGTTVVDGTFVAIDIVLMAERTLRKAAQIAARGG